MVGTALPRLGAVLGIAASLLLADPASGKVVYHDHVSGVDVHIEQEAHGPEFCPEVPFLVLFRADFAEHQLERTIGRSPFPHFTANYRARESYTNVENGKSLSFHTRVNGGDRRIVDNGDGTITIHLGLTGRTVTFGPDGERLFLESGRFHALVVIDYQGTPSDPDDDTELSFEVLHDTGRNDTSERDFCADLVTFLG